MSQGTPERPLPDPVSHLRHELRTPINQIVGYAELLQEEAADIGRQDFVQDLGRIVQAARRLLALIEGNAGALAAARAEPAAAPAAVAAAVEPGGEAEPAAAGGTLLVVDDDPENRDMLARRLQRRGYEVVTAERGQEALELLAGRRFDLVLLDVMMPGTSGLEVLQRLRATQGSADLPVIMATARDASADTVEALRLGANDYVTKPLDFPVVQARVETQLGLKKAMEEVRRLAAALELRNGFIRRMFGRYLSDEVVATLLETPAGMRMGGEKRVVTILMADLRGFSSMAERLEPEQVVSALNSYLAAMTEIITAHNGTIDEFIGDAILVLFGAPIAREDDARRAVLCALEMQLAMGKVNARNRVHGLPDLEMGISVNTGEVVVGNIGSHKRAKYGVVGSPVNLAGRIESFTVGGQVLISESTLTAAGPGLVVEDPMTIEAKGFAEPVAVYTLRGLAGDGALTLPRAGDDMALLDPPLAVRWCVLQGKHSAGPEQAGRLVRLSMMGAELAADESAEPRRDVRLRLAGSAAAEAAGEVYAKVVGAGSGALRLRFTAVPPAAGELFTAALAASRPARAG